MKLLSLSELVTLTGLSKSTIVRWEEEGNFPRRVLVGRSPRWEETDIQSWIVEKKKESAKESSVLTHNTTSGDNDDR